MYSARSTATEASQRSVTELAAGCLTTRPSQLSEIEHLAAPRLLPLASASVAMMDREVDKELGVAEKLSYAGLEPETFRSDQQHAMIQIMEL